MALSKSAVLLIGQSWPLAQQRISDSITLAFYRENRTRLSAFARNAFKLLFALGELKGSETSDETEETPCEEVEIVREWLALKAAFNDSFDSTMYEYIHKLKMEKVLPRECTSASDCFFAHLLKTETRFVKNLSECKALRAQLSIASEQNSKLESDLEKEKSRADVLAKQLEEANLKMSLKVCKPSEESEDFENVDWFFSL